MIKSSKEFKMESKCGFIFFDIKEDGNEHFLKITQSKSMRDGEFRREKIFITEQELPRFKEIIEQAIGYWNPPKKTKDVPSQPQKKAYTWEEKREQYGNAYLPWEKEADDLLKKWYGEGKTISELSEMFERQPSAIRSRLRKLGVVE